MLWKNKAEHNPKTPLSFYYIFGCQMGEGIFLSFFIIGIRSIAAADRKFITIPLPNHIYYLDFGLAKIYEPHIAINTKQYSAPFLFATPQAFSVYVQNLFGYASPFSAYPKTIFAYAKNTSVYAEILFAYSE